MTNYTGKSRRAPSFVPLQYGLTTARFLYACGKVPHILLSLKVLWLPKSVFIYFTPTEQSTEGHEESTGSPTGRPTTVSSTRQNPSFPSLSTLTPTTLTADKTIFLPAATISTLPTGMQQLTYVLSTSSNLHRKNRFLCHNSDYITVIITLLHR